MKNIFIQVLLFRPVLYCFFFIQFQLFANPTPASIMAFASHFLFPPRHHFDVIVDTLDTQADSVKYVRMFECIDPSVSLRTPRGGGGGVPSGVTKITGNAQQCLARPIPGLKKNIIKP